jgi:hypothetical protein
VHPGCPINHLFFYHSQRFRGQRSTMHHMNASVSLKLARQRAWHRRMLVALLNLNLAMRRWVVG